MKSIAAVLIISLGWNAEQLWSARRDRAANVNAQNIIAKYARSQIDTLDQLLETAIREWKKAQSSLSACEAPR
jgi:hypothetical protein